MINTPRQLSSWSLLKSTQYYLNTMIFRAERSRWGVGEESGPVPRAVAGAGFPPSPEEVESRLPPCHPLLAQLALWMQSFSCQVLQQHPHLKGPRSTCHQEVFSEHLVNEIVHSSIHPFIHSFSVILFLVYLKLNSTLPVLMGI